jgi:cytochrome c peroxidase
LVSAPPEANTVILTLLKCGLPLELTSRQARSDLESGTPQARNLRKHPANAAIPAQRRGVGPAKLTLAITLTLKENSMVLMKNRRLFSGVAAAAVIIALGSAYAQQGPRGKSSYMPVDITETFSSIFARLSAQKPEVTREHTALLNDRYDLSNRPAAGVTMDRTKPVQEGVRVKLSPGSSWEGLAVMTPEQIRDKNLFPLGFYPLPHPKHSEGGFVFPHFLIDEIKRQESRDLTRFDVEYDIPDHFLPEFPPAIYLNQRSDLGDVSQGKLVTIENYYELFNGIIPPKQLEGLRLLVTPFPQQQFNQTEDRRSELPSRGAACFDCHSNGHTNKATHLAPDARPQESRHRVTTPTLRGVQIQRLFGSQRALKTVEDFTQFEQAGAYFDGDHVIAAKKGMNPLDRLSQVGLMAEFQEELAFPPAPKLDVFGKLDPTKATPTEMRGQDVFFGKGQCGACHAAPYYTDNLMHDLKTERFFKPAMINGMSEVGDGAVKTFPLRGIKDSPPYMHDGRLLTLDDTVEFFNLVLGTKLTSEEKRDLVAFLRTL